MKAAVYYVAGPPSVCLYEDVPDPVCGPGDVLVDVEAISIEGGDTLNRAGGEMATSPHVVGYQCAGTIAEVGADVHDRRPGQRVVCTMLWGSHAERAATPSIITWVVPDGLDIVEAACVPWRGVPRTTACSSSGIFSRARRSWSRRASGVGLAPSSSPSGRARPCCDRIERREA
jgi:NADPH2:quinone reductase